VNIHTAQVRSQKYASTHIREDTAQPLVLSRISHVSGLDVNTLKGKISHRFTSLKVLVVRSRFFERDL